MPLDLLDDVFLLDFTLEAAKSAFQGFSVLDMDFSQSKLTYLSNLIVQFSSIVDNMTLVPIGVVRSPVKSAVDDVWGGVVSTIELDPQILGLDAAAGLDQFSHIDVIFHFHLVSAATLKPERAIPAIGPIGHWREFWPSAPNAGSIAWACPRAAWSASTVCASPSWISTRSTERPSSTSNRT